MKWITLLTMLFIAHLHCLCQGSWEINTEHGDSGFVDISKYNFNNPAELVAHGDGYLAYYYNQIRKHDMKGQLMTSFADSGSLCTNLPFGYMLKKIVVDSQNNLYTFSSTYYQGSAVQKYLPNGERDTGFATNGTYSFGIDSTQSYSRYQDILFYNGAIFMAYANSSNKKLHVIKLTPAGIPDLDYGNDGIVEIGSVATLDCNYSIIGTDQNEIISVFRNKEKHIKCIKIDSTGNNISIFNNDITVLADTLPGYINFNKITSIDSGYILAGNQNIYPEYNIIFFSIGFEGKINKSFGNNGFACYEVETSNIGVDVLQFESSVNHFFTRSKLCLSDGCQTVRICIHLFHKDGNIDSTANHFIKNSIGVTSDINSFGIVSNKLLLSFSNKILSMSYTEQGDTIPPTYVEQTKYNIIDNNDIKIFPNPIIETFNINFSEVQNKAIVQLYNLTGKINEWILYDTKSCELRVNGAPGLYMLKIHRDAQQDAFYKIIKK